MSGLGLTFLRRGGLTHPTAGSDYIRFADEEVFRILMSKGVSTDGVGITKDDAAAVKSIGTWFSGNTTIEIFDELQYFTSVVALEANAFKGCTSLKSLPIRQMQKILGSALYGCTSLTYDELNLDSLIELGGNAFYGVSIKKLYMPVLPSLPNSFNGYQTYGSNSIVEAITISPSVATIPSYSFNNYTALKEVNLGNIKTLQGNALVGTQVENADLISVETIANSGFNNMKYVKKIHIGPHCTSIGTYNFWGWTSGGSVDIIVEAANPPTLGSNNRPDFYGGNVYVPDASVDAYKAATEWSKFAAIIKGISEYNG